MGKAFIRGRDGSYLAGCREILFSDLKVAMRRRSITEQGVL